MAGPTSVNLMSTSAFEAFRQLTVGRDHNKGALELEFDKGGGKTLSCVNHHFWQHSKNEGISSGTQAKVRELLQDAVHGELDHFLEAACEKAVEGGGNADEMRAKIAGIKEAFDKAIMPEPSCQDVLLRSDIKKIVQNVSLLKENLTIDALRQMGVEQLANLATDKAAKRQVENLVGGGLLGRSAISHRETELRRGTLDPSDVRLRDELRGRLGTPRTFVANSLRRLQTELNAGRVGDVLPKWVKQFRDTLGMRVGSRVTFEIKVTQWDSLAGFLDQTLSVVGRHEEGCEQDDIAWRDEVMSLMKQVRDHIADKGIAYPNLSHVVDKLKLDA